MVFTNIQNREICERGYRGASAGTPLLSRRFLCFLVIFATIAGLNRVS